MKHYFLHYKIFLIIKNVFFRKFFKKNSLIENIKSFK
jgi:hypothetical protein